MGQNERAASMELPLLSCPHRNVPIDPYQTTYIARQASFVFPTAPGLMGMRTFLLEDYKPEVVGNMFIALLILDAAWILFGSLMFHLTDICIRKRGSLEKY